MLAAVQCSVQCLSNSLGGTPTKLHPFFTSVRGVGDPDWYLWFLFSGGAGAAAAAPAAEEGEEGGEGGAPAPAAPGEGMDTD